MRVTGIDQPRVVKVINHREIVTFFANQQFGIVTTFSGLNAPNQRVVGIADPLLGQIE